MAAEPAQDAPPRRGGRGCGYEGHERLKAANRSLGAALTKLARDPQPGPRAVGAELAAMVAQLVDQAAAVAADSTTAARRAEADVAAQLPRLAAQLTEAQARARHLRESTP